jgi:chromosomal replication initiator protein
LFVRFGSPCDPGGFALPFSSASSASQLWEATLGQLLLRVTRQNYDTWLRNTVGLHYDGTTLVVSAPNDLTCDWLSTRMRSVIVQALTTVAGPGLQVRFEPPVAEGQASPTAPLQPALLPGANTPLNPRFTFATFLVADFNRLAFTAARSIAAPEGNAYSPLFITGNSGNGKTHLLHAIAHEALASGTKLLFATAEQFLSEFTTAVRNRNGAAFRARYREVDLLLIDDVHVLLGKKATLNEFYQTLAVLHDHGRRVAVAGDLGAVVGEAVRFRSQLRWGLVASIETPPAEDRVHFVEAKAKALGVELPNEVEHYLALRVRSSIRDLEGAVNRIAALSHISSESITIDFAARALQPVALAPLPAHAPPPPSEFLHAVCRHLGLDSAAVLGQRRNRDLTYARHLTMYLLRQDGGLTYMAIAHLLGKKDHSTVVHACAQIHKERNASPTIRADIDAIRALIHQSGTAA